MLNRRSFLQSAAAVTATTLWADKFSFGAAPQKLGSIGIQLYTLRDQMEKDFEGTLAKVAKIGYKEVEFAGYYGRTPKQVRTILDNNGLKSPACHVQYEALAKDKWQAELDSAKAIGQSYIVQPWIPEPLRKTADDWKRAAETFNRAGEASHKAGVQLAYHNHWFEFAPVDGKLPYDMLLELCDKNYVKMEMDLCWVTSAGADPVQYFEKHKGRFPLVHVKDFKFKPKPTDTDPSKFLTEVGSGMIDWKRIFAKSEVAGIKHYFVENDAPGAKPFEGVEKSFGYLKNLKF